MLGHLLSHLHPISRPTRLDRELSDVPEEYEIQHPGSEVEWAKEKAADTGEDKREETGCSGVFPILQVNQKLLLEFVRLLKIGGTTYINKNIMGLISPQNRKRATVSY